MSAPPFYATTNRPRALVEGLTVVLLFFGYQFSGALLGKGTEQRLDHPLLSVLLTGLVMLLPVLAFSVRDRTWRESLGVGPLPWSRLAGLSALGVIGAYGLNVVASLVFLAFFGGLKDLATARAGWMAKLADLPAPIIVPLVLFVGLWEEVVFRGFLLGRLRAALPLGSGPDAARRRDVLAVVAVSLCFGLGHGYQGVLGMVQTTVVGLVFSALVVFGKSLWPAVLAHATIDGFGLFALKVLKPWLQKVAEGKFQL